MAKRNRPKSPGRGSLNQTELAKEFGVSRQTVNTWDHEGLAAAARTSDDPVEYDPSKAWHWRMENRPPNTGPSQSMKELDLREKAAKVKVAELDAAEREGELIPVVVMDDRVSEAFARIRAKAIAFKGALAPRLVGLDDARDAKAVLDTAFDELIEELRIVTDEFEEEADDAA